MLTDREQCKDVQRRDSLSWLGMATLVRLNDLSLDVLLVRLSPGVCLFFEFWPTRGTRFPVQIPRTVGTSGPRRITPPVQHLSTHLTLGASGWVFIIASRAKQRYVLRVLRHENAMQQKGSQYVSY